MASPPRGGNGIGEGREWDRGGRERDRGGEGKG